MEKDSHDHADTLSEILGQPHLWQEVFEAILEHKQGLEAFLVPILHLEDLRIILTGAGSSAFIGEAVQGILQDETQRMTEAIATTNLVTHPKLFFLKQVPTLMISFARSGNSPESLEAIHLANFYCEHIFHLIITCNKSGEIVKNRDGKRNYIFLLPEKSNDKGLAMTGSFTSMLLSITLIAKLYKIDTLEPSLVCLKEIAYSFMNKQLSSIKNIARRPFKRMIFLGSGPLLGIARECHLKLQELTDGQVICKYDSFLGFRHGPRVVANEEAIIVYLFSNDDFVFQYEKDLVESIAADLVVVPTISFGRKVSAPKSSLLDIEFSNQDIQSNEFYFIAATLLGQSLGFYKSLDLGLNPDNPSVSGRINRVVQGVSIYSIENNEK
ncbi:SIS domain-containing protein [Pedobacter immunditicola]|uniref:SIS domain-containing protein n=1 Tax=Pedobacter immunditicola TaxID=3133440 RepID=UPI00309CEC45